jgi:hypothetical protein
MTDLARADKNAEQEYLRVHRAHKAGAASHEEMKAAERKHGAARTAAHQARMGPEAVAAGAAMANTFTSRLAEGRIVMGPEHEGRAPAHILSDGQFTEFKATGAWSREGTSSSSADILARHQSKVQAASGQKKVMNYKNLDTRAGSRVGNA